ncbi:MAG: hypothetical protein U0792_17755 [Gemmataceae bacterium]
MWSFRSEEVDRGRVHKFALERNSSPVPYSEVLRLWEHDADFRAFFVAILTQCPFAEFRWETPPIAADTVERPFEFVLLNSPGLAYEVDREAFAEHFTAPGEVVAFANLRGDATLVVPCPVNSASDYRHIAAFVRHAPEPQQYALWQLVGKTASRRLGKKPLWISTAGAGVSWLHVRLDDTPKYYGYRPYRET